MQSLRQEIRYGLRTIRESPGFAAVTVLTLALCIGANTAIFGVLDPLVLRNLPLWRPDELVEVAPNLSKRSASLVDIRPGEAAVMYVPSPQYADRSDAGNLFVRSQNPPGGH